MTYYPIGYSSLWSSTTCNFEIRTDGNVLNGGGFACAPSTYNTGTDRSQSADPHVNTDDASVSASTVTGATANARAEWQLSGYDVSAEDVGNVVQVSSTGDAGAYVGLFLIASVDTTANTWRVSYGSVRDSSLDSTPTNVELRMGGALPSIGLLCDWCGTDGDTSTQWINEQAVRDVFIKSGTYTMTTDTVNANHGPIRVADVGWCIIGYETTRGDNGERPVIDVASSGVTGIVWRFEAGYYSHIVQNIEINMRGTADTGFEAETYINHSWFNCRAVNIGDGCTGFYKGEAYACEAVGTTGGDGQQDGTGFDRTHNMYCIALGCYRGYERPDTPVLHSLAHDCYTGFRRREVETAAVLAYCVADACDEGFELRYIAAASCIATNCTTGFTSGDGTKSYNPIVNCVGYNNTTHTHNLDNAPGWTTLAADPWENQSADDFRLNDAETGGALLRSIGLGPPGQTADSDKNFFVTEKSGGGSSVIPARPIQIGA